MLDSVTDSVVVRLQAVPTALVTDALTRLQLSGWMDDVLPLSPGSRLVARARTLAFGPTRRTGQLTDSTYRVISQVERGQVLVMGAGGAKDQTFGENIGTFAHRSGLAGIVTDSRTRDRIGLRELGMPVFSRGPGVRPPTEVEPRDIDVPIICGGAQVRPGDIVVGDDDGVVVIPSDREEDVLYQIEELEELERGIGEVIRAGGSVTDIEREVARKKVVRR